MKIKTSTLQAMLTKSTKAASMNKMLPLTSLIGIFGDEQAFSLVTTDALNTLQLFAQADEPENGFYAIVAVDTFAKLIAKTTSEFVTLWTEAGKLMIKGNGKYQLEMPMDESGVVMFPIPPRPDLGVEAGFSAKIDSLLSVLRVNKAALPDTEIPEMPWLTGYFFKDASAITTDSFKICHNAINIFDQPTLLAAGTVELLALFTGTDLKVYQRGKQLFFKNFDSSFFLWATELEGIEKYPDAAVIDFVKKSFPSSMSMAKADILQCLDRLGLVVSPYDENGIMLTFAADGLILRSKSTSGEEVIGYRGVANNFKPFVCCVDIELFRSQIAARPEELIHLNYGINGALKLSGEVINQIMSLSTMPE